MIYVLIGYMWLFIHRPFEIWPVLADIRLERIYMVLALGCWAIRRTPAGRAKWMPNPLHQAFFAFAGAFLLCWLMSPWSGDERPQRIVEDYLKQWVFYVLLVTAVTTEDDLKKVCTALLGIMGLYMAHSLKEYKAGRHTYRMGIARMIGVDSSLGDPNSFSASIVYVLPFIAAAWVCLPGRRGRALLAGYLALSVLCTLLTGSRGGLLGLAAWTLVTVLRSRHRFRLLVPIALLAPVIWLALPPGLQNRFQTIIDPSVGPANAQESAEQRAEGLHIGLTLWQANPIFGCGPGAWRPASGSHIESHNLYGQVIGEMGTLGAVTFAAVVALTWWNAHQIKSAYRRNGWERDFLYGVGDSVQMGVLLLLLLGYGAHSLYRYTWLWYGGFAIIARHCVLQRLDALEAGPPDGAAEAEDMGGLRWTYTQA